MLTGGWGAKSFGVVFAWSLMILAILKGGTNSFHALKGGVRKVLPCLERGGVQKVSDLRFSHFVAPLHIINDQSLSMMLKQTFSQFSDFNTLPRTSVGLTCLFPLVFFQF